MKPILILFGFFHKNTLKVLWSTNVKEDFDLHSPEPQKSNKKIIIRSLGILQRVNSHSVLLLAIIK